MRRRSSVGAVVAAVLLAPVVLSSPASGTTNRSAAPPRAAQPTTVTIEVGDNYFAPKNVEVAAGTTVKWVNKGRNLHDIKPNKGKKFGIARLASGKKYKYTFKKPGKYAYYCSFHGSPGSGQWGSVKVVAPPPPPPTSAPAPAPSASFTGDGDGQGFTAHSTIEVPGDAKTIQAAVDRAKPGDLVLVSPGVYKEAVTVTTDGIVIRGVDRNRTILDGEFRRPNGIKVVDADGVAIENLTARNYEANGFFWTGVDGYRGSYLTAVRNGDYAVYAYDSVNGQFDHSYGSGSPDAGFYIGECRPCNAVVTDVEAEWNGIGFSGTNASGDLYIVDSSWHDNRIGIVPNSGSYEDLPPQGDATIVGNDVRDNNNDQTAAIEIAQLAIGNGILLAGGNGNVVERNLVVGHDLTGIGVIPLPEKLTRPDDPNAINFDARSNQVRDNVVRESGEADLALVATIDSDTDAGGNCFSGNEYTSSLPADVETLVPCDAPASPTYKTELGRFAELLTAKKPPAIDYRKARVPKVPAQPNMPKAKRAKARPATDEPTIKVDLDSIEVPKA